MAEHKPGSYPPVPYPDVHRVLHDLLERIRAILGHRFIGLYLYGSLATGDFQPLRSDIDFVAVTDDLLPDRIIAQLESMHQDLLASGSKWAEKLEGAYIPRYMLRRHEPGHPAVPTINEKEFYLAPLGRDWVIQRHVLREHDTGIVGPPLTDLIDPVKPEDLRSAVLDVLARWWQPMVDEPSRLRAPGYQPFAVLSMCRTLYTLENGELISKTGAASWALRTLPAEWASLISHAVEWGAGEEIESIDRTVDFIQYVIQRSQRHH